MVDLITNRYKTTTTTFPERNYGFPLARIRIPSRTVVLDIYQARIVWRGIDLFDDHTEVSTKLLHKLWKMGIFG